MQQPGNDPFLSHKGERAEKRSGPRRGLHRSFFGTLLTLLIDVPLAIFLMTALTTATFWQVPTVASAAAFVGLVTSVAAGARADGDRIPQLTGCAAVVSGVVSGVYAHEVYLGPFFAIAFGSEYNDILASKPVAAFADAGRLHFAKSSVVDTARSVGFQDGRTYCAAPIIDSGDAQTRTVGFWAVGYDCCNARGDFECGAADDNETVTGVVFASDGLLASSRTEFLRAVNQSAAVNDLIVDEEPLLVRWVEDAGREQTVLFFCALGVLTLGGLVFVLFVLTAAGISAWAAAPLQPQGVPK